MANNSSKQYSNIQIIDGVKKNGSTYKFIAVRGYISNLQDWTFPPRNGEAEGGFVVHARLPVSNRNRMLNTALGINLPTGGDEVTWVQVSLWDKVGSRLLKFIGERKSALVDIFGALTSEEYTGRDGNPAVSVKITAYDFWNVPTGKSQGQTSAQTQATANNQTRDGASSYSEGSYVPDEVQTAGDYFNYNDDDDDLPF